MSQTLLNTIYYQKRLKNNKYLVEVPDLNSVAEGKNLNDAIFMARNVMGIVGVDLV